MTNIFNCRSLLSPILLGAGLCITISTSVSAGEFPAPTFITMKLEKTVEKFPNQTVWKGGPNMLYNSVTPDGKLLFATSPSTGSVYVFNTKTGSTKSIIKAGKAPKGVKISPNGKYAYISNEASATISVIKIKTLKVIDTIKVKEKPHNVRFHNNGKIAYVTLQGGAGLGVIDTTKRKMTHIIPLPGLTGPHNMDLSPDGNTAFVRDIVNNVAVLDIKTEKVKKIIKVGTGHAGIDVLPDGRYVVTGAIGDKVVSIIDPVSMSVIKQIDVGTGPHGVRASKNSRWIYVTVTAENKVVVIDAQSLEIVKKIDTGKFPFWVAVRGNA